VAPLGLSFSKLPIRLAAIADAIAGAAEFRPEEKP
jgi:hypothetical protein